jgi:AcrR family transcriptional regulator
MIADKIGVTKAAVYHQFNTKEEIVLAAAEEELAWLEATIDAAEQEDSSAGARDALLSHIVTLAVERRRTTSIILNDPVIARLFPENKTFRRVMARMNRMLMGNDAGPDGQIETAMLIAAISGAAIHPLCVDLDDGRLRSQLLHLARRFLGLPD